MEVAKYAPPYFASNSLAWSPFDFFSLFSSFPSPFEENICLLSPKKFKLGAQKFWKHSYNKIYSDNESDSWNPQKV